MPVFIRNERPVIDEDFLEPAFIIQPTKPLTTPPITTETTVNSGVSAIVEPNLSNPSDNTSSSSNIPSGNTSGTSSNVPSGNTTSISNVPSGNTSGNTSGTSNVPSGSNVENKSSATIIQKKPNYVLYGGILISAIILYKLLK